jgi:hypothetical protein
MDKEMKIQDALKVMIDYQHWRRGGNGTQTDCKQLGVAIDIAIKLMTESFIKETKEIRDKNEEESDVI